LRQTTFDGEPLGDLAAWNGRDDLVIARREGLGWDPAAGTRTLSLNDVDAAVAEEIEDVWIVCHYEVDWR
jgi:hypothetical protein